MQNGAVVAGLVISNGRCYAGRTYSERTTDEELVEAIGDGNSLAMQILFARHRVRVYRFIVRMVGNVGIAEDLTSEVFITVWRRAAQFEARSSVSTWLLAIARFKSLTELRRKYRSDSRLSDSRSNEHLADECVSETPESELQADDRKRIVGRCLMRLSHEHRTIIDLVYYHEKSVSEVAEILGICQNTAKTRMHYARRKLAQLLEQAGVVGVAS